MLTLASDHRTAPLIDNSAVAFWVMSWWLEALSMAILVIVMIFP
ncbi:hypothetical protein HMPREF9622_00954 [Cutibacterium modestum HL037PA3]|uniref:Uncharacterized protein n=1 Tax=Cutibacterium modestum HL044PA1 TaxID=765109 RepID=A0ABP2K415_9ACTN|nr:hypothetical protein HMPREF9621_00569 [Cutibacterium modestum HL037PA2]EFS91589.1 hypothetical protein HMPREF9607_02095 [Cutibacterium modestum HL044PA1]EFT16093.1 hypothetical protein HMPREF9622_00954 [Cutibacterium modestum HL037PA3]